MNSIDQPFFHLQSRMKLLLYLPNIDNTPYGEDPAGRSDLKLVDVRDITCGILENVWDGEIESKTDYHMNSLG